MTIENFETALKLANEFLATKERENYYSFEAIDENHPDYIYYSNPLSDEEIAQFRALKEKYGDKFVKHLDEVYDDPDIIHDFTCGCDIVDIDLEHTTHQYTFKIHELRPDGTVYSHNYKIELSDEEYAKLIAWHLYDEHCTINTLRLRDAKLFDTIMRRADWYFYEDGWFYCADTPYLITFEEAKADAEVIIKQHNIKRTGGYISL